MRKRDDLHYREGEDGLRNPECPWCRNTFWTTDPRKEYCDHKHVVSASKRRRKRLCETWVSLCFLVSEGRMTREEAEHNFEAKGADWVGWAVQKMGYHYDPYQKEWQRTV